ncbi:hypothetical protein [Francisella philomiragia]|uniref:hypothetical protein n=1 Tax=Francisella philomiragia TaxID=28110 RepID=UPI001907D7D3|nr:hypothetical protein [Francisella philomiragia]MBK2268295.1 hypothetical protein [Francisella philomiragia]MBK2279710.1 hypothetical protein [Francisella philomiragia]MBK2287606.1 hypothetical protein [Francisella philomiragia]MBK2289585.1 hypothetical protein [Francisella philomiragia]MBK2291483.1 hypothetical protein [Francisella philomiragia]
MLKDIKLLSRATIVVHITAFIMLIVGVFQAIWTLNNFQLNAMYITAIAVAFSTRFFAIKNIKPEQKNFAIGVIETITTLIILLVSVVFLTKTGFIYRLISSYVILLVILALSLNILYFRKLKFLTIDVSSDSK